MSILQLSPYKNFKYILYCSILSSFFPGLILSAVVTLSSIEIFRTHDWINWEPTIYFRCKDENKTSLPDVKEKHVLFTFKGEESWQPLIEFTSKKCKRCGFYEEDILKSDVFDEWEFCPSDFIVPDGTYNRLKENEFNATFSCPECITAFGGASVSESHGHRGGKIAMVVFIVLVVSSVVILGVVAVYKFWKKKKRQEEQARFLELFEEGDEIEDELGLGPVV